MHHFGIIALPHPGHLNPLAALGRQLVRLGHRATLFNIADVMTRPEHDGLEHVCIGEEGFPPGSHARSWGALMRLRGVGQLRAGWRLHARLTRAFCDDVPAAARAAGITALLVDETQVPGAALAAHLGVPHITVATGLTMLRDPWVPPMFSPRLPSPGWPARLRNRAGYFVLDRVIGPVLAVANRYARRWGVAQARTLEDTFSRRLHVLAMPPGLDFPRRATPASVFHAGALIDADRREPALGGPRLPDRPIVYASLGTHHGHRLDLLTHLADALQGLSKQATCVLALGAWGDRDRVAASRAALAGRTGDVRLVDFAPQLALLSRAALCITHGGCNTVMESLAQGVPMVVVPLADDQPGLAARVAHAGAGLVVPPRALRAEALRAAALRVLEEPPFKQAAARLAAEIRTCGGAAAAAAHIDATLRGA